MRHDNVHEIHVLSWHSEYDLDGQKRLIQDRGRHNSYLFDRVGSGEGRDKINLVVWDKVFAPKEEGGPGIHRFS